VEELIILIYSRKKKDEITERNDTVTENDINKYENKSTSSKLKSEFSLEKKQIEVMNPLKLKDNKKFKKNNKSFTNKKLKNLISPSISESETGNQDIIAINQKDNKINRTNIIIDNDNNIAINHRKNSKDIYNAKKNFIRNNLDTIEALTPQRNIKNKFSEEEEDDVENELVMNNQILLKSNGSKKILNQMYSDN
jgi:hypothetical protein